MTPLNFAFWGNLHPLTADLMQQVAMSPWEMLEVIVMLLGVPLVLGMGGQAIPRLCAQGAKSR